MECQKLFFWNTSQGTVMYFLGVAFWHPLIVALDSMYKLRKFHKKPYILNRALLFYDSKNLVDLHEIASATSVPMTPRSPSRSQSGTATPKFTIVSRQQTSNSAMPQSQSQSKSRSRSVSNEASTEITMVAGESETNGFAFVRACVIVEVVMQQFTG